MRFQPVNPDPKWPARHTLYLATTGGGKSQMLNANTDIPKVGARVILWDQAGDHPGLHFTSKAGFLKHLKGGIQRGGGFRVAYAGPADPQQFEWFCEVVWSVLDGKHKTYVIAEELSAVCETAGKALPNAAILLNQGRKYGLEFHATSQKPQEVSKTYFDNAAILYVGQQKGEAMRKRMASQLGLTFDEVAGLQSLQFYRDDGSAERPQLITLKGKEIKGVVWKD